MRDLRLRLSAEASNIERAAVRDVSSLLGKAVGVEIPTAASDAPAGAFDLWVGRSDQRAMDLSRPQANPGAFRLTEDGPYSAHVVGADAEGVRNGLYTLLQRIGFHFFRDGDTIPDLSAPDARLALESILNTEQSPAFPLRGDMVWDHYLGPRRFCASMWLESDWERALLFMARRRMNFLEFYPPMERLSALAFPEVKGLENASVFEAEYKHELMQRVVKRGRELGIRFMYVLTYGAFVEPVRRHFSNLEWRNGFCCAHQPQLQEMTETLWQTLVAEFGTDHLYAIRHRGEEEQVYSDPCRSVSKTDGFHQAFEVLKRVDQEAEATVWTWGESLPDLFDSFPTNVSAAHIRHGMANVFGDFGEGREQQMGRPPLDDGRDWFSAQFTAFGANEAQLQTSWSGVRAIAEDARTSLDQGARGFFQWPEWSDTSPWTSNFIAELAWDPKAPVESVAYLEDYAAARHGERKDAFVAAFRPLLRAGNARFTQNPWKRLVVPYFLSSAEQLLTTSVQRGLGEMVNALDGSSPVFQRDLIDIACWLGWRQAFMFDAHAYLMHVDGNISESEGAFGGALAAWDALQGMMSVVPERSLIETAKYLSARAPLSSEFEDSLWELGGAFYNGYPLVLSPEAVAFVYRPQSLELDARMREKEASSEILRLDPPGWYWHDFVDPSFRDTVRRMPDIDAQAFQSAFKDAVQRALVPPAGSGGGAASQDEMTPSGPSSVDLPFLKLALQPLLTAELPPILEQLPQLPS